ncbi:phosphotransferase [Arthrobacter sp. ISL-28]|uniref:phosphotransferase n=1 Tax=Arthrobacter sp. ISL-28 TaxID=2819108 RepID=UPI001BE6D297|nr:aminoglycoside phosphotransferase family protein [Arthrobacter sp. ISL-28]MBT2523214.1 aminoglycoside phosphotransferase family protein [Arthrobacter sp. ISL-28]
MQHGYTNETYRQGLRVGKRYQGPDAEGRAAAELLALTRLVGRIPVPAVIDAGELTLTTAFVPGEHGQDLIESGPAEETLAACGRLLRDLHMLDPGILEPGPHPAGAVIRHGDFGPNNVLMGPEGFEPVALLDWEFSGIGTPIDDLAWCEWIVRMHHPAAIPALRAFWEAYGSCPEWAERQAAMLNRCAELEDFCRRWSSPDAVTMWQKRIVVTRGWTPGH